MVEFIVPLGEAYIECMTTENYIQVGKKGQLTIDGWRNASGIGNCNSNTHESDSMYALWHWKWLRHNQKMCRSTHPSHNSVDMCVQLHFSSPAPAYTIPTAHTISNKVFQLLCGASAPPYFMKSATKGISKQNLYCFSKALNELPHIISCSSNVHCPQNISISLSTIPVSTWSAGQRRPQI